MESRGMICTWKGKDDVTNIRQLLRINNHSMRPIINVGPIVINELLVKQYCRKTK